MAVGSSVGTGSGGGVGSPTLEAAPSCCMPVADRARLERDLRKAASLAAPLLAGAPFRAVRLGGWLPGGKSCVLKEGRLVEGGLPG